MRYAILSDIHGNLEALTAVLEHLASQRIDRYLCVGDLVGYGADPEACLARLQRPEVVSVGGNHDWACLGRLELEWFTEAAQHALRWTRDRLSFSDLDLLRRLPLVTRDGPFTLVHGTLRHPERFEYLVDLGQALETATTCETPICLVGHTHVPLVFEYDLPSRRMRRLLTSPRELTEVRLVNDPAQVRYVINPGSVGQPRDGDPRASVAIVDPDTAEAFLHRVPYDIPTAQGKIRRAGLPALFADRLAIGR